MMSDVGWWTNYMCDYRQSHLLDPHDDWRMEK